MSGCSCGEKYPGKECAHTLTNWMIVEGQLEPNPLGCYCCPKGRPIRAKEVWNHIFKKNYTEYTTEPSGDSYVFCSDKPNGEGQGHVYYGKKSSCAKGTGAYPNWPFHRYYQ